ncbi:hypothetical protein HYV83_04720 [Candidatus Woesearchaeota archaeon]|nr:hypothetical protein [Candidatus Woesearchaeota archaeon]
MNYNPRSEVLQIVKRYVGRVQTLPHVAGVVYHVAEGFFSSDGKLQYGTPNDALLKVRSVGEVPVIFTLVSGASPSELEVIATSAMEHLDAAMAAVSKVAPNERHQVQNLDELGVTVEGFAKQMGDYLVAYSRTA